MGRLDPRESVICRPKIAVIGASSAPAETLAIAEDVGSLVAQAGWHLICGGGSGVMEAACRGFVANRPHQGGMSIGILPSGDETWANPYVDIPIPTGLGWARNAVITQTANGLIAIGGCSGTLSEIAFAWQMGRPIVALGQSGGWAGKLAGQPIDHRRTDRVMSAKSPSEAIAFLASVLEDKCEQM